MRILTILLIALAFSISSFAQQGVQERAKKITDEMTDDVKNLILKSKKAKEEKIKLRMKDVNIYYAARL